MTSAAETAFTALVDRAERDQSVLALVLGGGRGKGQCTQSSDFDVYLVLTSDAPPREYEAQPPVVDVVAMTLDAFGSYADFGTMSEWNRYNFAHVTPRIDKTGGAVQEILNRMEYMPPDVSQRVAEDSLDGYLNSCYRSAKNARDGNLLAALMDAAESVPHLLDFIFAAEGRVKAYNKFLAWELQQHPLQTEAWPGDLLTRLKVVVSTGDLAIQGLLYRRAVTAARQHGLGGVVDAWGSEALAVLDDLPNVRTGHGTDNV